MDFRELTDAYFISIIDILQECNKMDFKKRKINLLEEDLHNNFDNQPQPSKPKLNFKRKHKADSNEPTREHSGKRRGKKKLPLFFIILIIAFLGMANLLAADNDGFLSGVKNSYLVRQITHIISSKEQYLAGEQEDRINFVLLGMGGAGHNGPYLTDTIMIASFKPSSKEATIFSLPRDMIVPIDSNNYRKINSVYTIGQNNGVGGGELMKKILTNTFNIPVHYFAAVDFNGFIEMIDAIDGVEINVDTGFVDNQFPTYDEKWQSVSFDAGKQTMDGLTALRYSRSRHGNNGEGSDFARIKRQQKVILAAKEKLTSFNTLINPSKITSLFSLFTKYTSTDLEPWEAVKLVHMGKELNTQNIVTQSIDDRPGGYLKAGIAEDGAYILQPVTGNYSQINLLIKNTFDLQQASQEKAKIVIQNGTIVPGLALEAVNYLDQIGYNIIRYGNATTQDKISTIIYDYTNNNPKTKESLENVFSIKSKDNIPLDYDSSVVASNWGIRDDNGELAQIDFLIILGQDQIIDEGIEIITTIDPSLLLSSSTTTSTEEEIE
ncbi:MAG: LCP family protein [Candidatus Komeilibacteria bacterium]|jgi:polyisoprenyl-teichoic acid--peptidoglycan teichoic acid transferase|nr:LCP family protein [Candidatus Komeilibacteria bacterium]MBT4447242.1 LCP family protein [Candidatus Komeilibacteria bacterium]